MAINLQKGPRIEIGLTKVCGGLGWDENEGSGAEFDLDASAFMLGSNKKLPSDEFLVFYNGLQISSDMMAEQNLTIKARMSPDKSVFYTGDDTTGGNSDGGDDESIIVDLTKIDSSIQEIVFTATIYDCESRRQNFGQVRNSYIRIYNEATNEEIAKYELDEDFSIETAVEFGRLYKRNNEWKFEAMGVGFKGGLDYFVNKYQ